MFLPPFTVDVVFPLLVIARPLVLFVFRTVLTDSLTGVSWFILLACWANHIWQYDVAAYSLSNRMLNLSVAQTGLRGEDGKMDWHIWKMLKRVLRKLDQLLSVQCRFEYSVGPIKNKKEGRCSMLEITITNEQQVNVVLHPVTATGRPTTVDGAPTWTVQSGDSTVTPAADGLSADLISSDTPGDTEILVEADADLGQGVIPISDIIRLTVAHANAANLGLVAGDPTPKP